MKNIVVISTLIPFLASVAGICLAQGPFNVGTIHPGDSIVVYYDVSINTPLVPANASSISHQGSVSGSNFATLLTNNPATPAPADATVTLLNTPLPVTFRDFTAFAKETSVMLNWTIIAQENTLKYEVERSADARIFRKLGEVAARNESGVINYGFSDHAPLAGPNYYRLKVLDLDATFAYTRIIRASVGEPEGQSNFYPNPATGKTVNLELLNIRKGLYLLTFYNAAGQLVYTRELDHNGGSAAQIITMPENIQTGIYNVEIKGETLKIYKKLVVQ